MRTRVAPRQPRAERRHRLLGAPRERERRRTQHGPNFFSVGNSSFYWAETARSAAASWTASMATPPSLTAGTPCTGVVRGRGLRADGGVTEHRLPGESAAVRPRLAP